jgi:hypothetical protein
MANNDADDPSGALSESEVSGLLGTASPGAFSPHFSQDDFLDDNPVSLFLSGAASIDGFRLLRP